MKCMLMLVNPAISREIFIFLANDQNTKKETRIHSVCLKKFCNIDKNINYKSTECIFFISNRSTVFDIIMKPKNKA